MNLKVFFIWWNRQTFGTFLKTLFFGKFVGKDEFGNKYYKSKTDERWVIYSKDVEATKITSDWYLWMHHTVNKIPEKKTEKNTFGKKSILKIRLEQKILINRLKLKKDVIKKNMRAGIKLKILI